MSAGPDHQAASRGFTLIELVVTIALIGIMATLAVPNFISFQRNSQLTGAANTFIGAVATARAEAMKRNHGAYVSPSAVAVNSTACTPSNGSDWSGGWMVWVDMNGDGTFGTGDLTVMCQDAIPASITMPSTTGSTQFTDSNGTFVLFNGSGFPRRSPGATAIATPQSVDFAIGSATDPASVRRVNVSPTGRMWVCKPGTGGDAGCTQ